MRSQNLVLVSVATAFLPEGPVQVPFRSLPLLIPIFRLTGMAVLPSYVAGTIRRRDGVAVLPEMEQRLSPQARGTDR